MKIYNTLNRQKEELETIQPNKVSIYACGPTVYNFIHIGNARPICVFDVLRRYLEYRGYAVKYVLQTILSSWRNVRSGCITANAV